MLYYQKCRVYERDITLFIKWCNFSLYFCFPYILFDSLLYLHFPITVSLKYLFYFLSLLLFMSQCVFQSNHSLSLSLTLSLSLSLSLSLHVYIYLIPLLCLYLFLYLYFLSNFDRSLLRPSVFSGDYFFFLPQGPGI